MGSRRAFWLVLCGLPALLAGVVAGAAPAAEWKEMVHPPFHFVFLEENRPQALSLAARALEVLSQLEQDLGLSAPPEIQVRILPPRRETDGPGPPHWIVGFVPGGSGVVVLRGDLIRSYPFEDLLSLFGHEMTHILINTLPGGSAGVPHWFNEGVAVMESRRWSLRDAFTLSALLLVGPPTPLSRLAGAFPDTEAAARTAYAESFSFMSHLEKEHGPGAVRRILREMAGGRNFDEAFEAVTGGSVASAEEDWRDRVTLAYRWIPALTSTSVLWMGITLLVIFGRVAKRRRERAIQEAWKREGLG